MGALEDDVPKSAVKEAPEAIRRGPGPGYPHVFEAALLSLETDPEVLNYHVTHSSDVSRQSHAEHTPLHHDNPQVTGHRMEDCVYKLSDHRDFRTVLRR